MTTQGINLFWDNSNIWLVGQKVCFERERCEETGFRIHFASVLDFARDNRPVDFAFVGGSVPPLNDNLWRHFDDLGIDVHRQERGGGSGQEVAVDEIIQLQMATRILDEPPGTMLLLTGDGSGYGDGRGFLKMLERAHKKGWKIELVSWDIGCNRYLRDFVQQNGTYRPLEPVYDQVTFIQNQRFIRPF